MAGRARRLLAVAATAFVMALVLLPARATDLAQTTADEPHYLLTALSLAEDGSFDYGDERAELRYWPFHSVQLPIQAEIQPDGSRVAPHDPLLPVLLAVPMGLGGWVAAKVALALVAAATAALLAYLLERRAGLRPRAAAAAATLAFASPPLVVYATQVYPELPAGLAALVAVAAITSTRPLRRTAPVALAAVVALPWLSVKYAPVAAVLAIGLLARCSSERRWVALAGVLGGFTASGLLFAVVHLELYGGLTPYAAGTHFGEGELSVAGDVDLVARVPRLTGLLIDRAFGLAAWQPLFLLLPAGVAVWVVVHRGPGRWLLPATVAAGWGTASFVALTMHGWWWPGRQTVIVLPVGVLAIGALVARWSPRAQRSIAAAGLIGPWAAMWLAGGVYAGRHTLIVDFDRTADPIGRVWRLLLLDLRADRTLHDLLHAAWSVALVGATVLVALRARRAGGTT